MRSKWLSFGRGFGVAVLTAALVASVTGCAGPHTTPVASAAAPTFVGDFETGNFNQWPVCQDVAVGSVTCSKLDGSGYGMRVEDQIVRQGRFAARFELRHGDVPTGICCGARAEVSGDAAVQAGEGDERWYQWSTRFGEEFPSGVGWSVLSQWHADADGSPPVAILANVTADRWGIVLTKWDSPNDQDPPKFAPWSAPVVRGVWNDIKMHVKWSARDDIGFIELWINGAPQVFTDAPCSQQTRCATRTLMPGGGGVYFKQGYYRDSSIAATGVVYHDGFSAANAEDSLVPL
ncbi:MAG: polysaccharide lyase [Mycobacterium sp.]